MTNRATDDCAGNRMMPRDVPGYSANGRTFETTCRLGLNTAQAQHDYCHINRILHPNVPLLIFAGMGGWRKTE